MRNDKRNRATINELAPNSKAAALKWYDYCIKNDVEILVYEGRRTEAEQRANVNKGVSQTMKSYHIVGQALDFVPIDSKGIAQWSAAAYKKEPYKSAIAYAKSIGFEWGGDWSGFIDAPHLQFNYKGYGTDKTLQIPTKTEVKSSDNKSIVPYPGNPIDKTRKNDKVEDVKRVQKAANVFADGVFGQKTEDAVKRYQAKKGLKADGIVGPSTWYMMF